MTSFKGKATLSTLCGVHAPLTVRPALTALAVRLAVLYAQACRGGSGESLHFRARRTLQSPMCAFGVVTCQVGANKFSRAQHDLRMCITRRAPRAAARILFTAARRARSPVLHPPVTRSRARRATRDSHPVLFPRYGMHGDTACRSGAIIKI